MLVGASASERPVLSHLGFYPGYGSAAGLTSFEQWLGRKATYVVQFSDANSAKAFSSSIWGQTAKADAFQTVANRVTLVESVPLTIGLGFGSTNAQRVAALNATRSGANDATFRQGAQHIKSAGFRNVIVRLGWEFDGGWMPWSSAGNEALWASAYRHAADVFRSVLPNARFDWTGSRGRLQAEANAYPGDGYVDIVGLDVYDKGVGGPWNPATKSWADPVAAWSKSLAGLTFQRDFAIAHGKQVSYPEWALADGGIETPGNAGGDDPTFIQGMYNWMNHLPTSGPGSLAYHAYFNEDTAHDGHHVLAHFPKAAQRYRTLFGTNPGGGSAEPTVNPAAPVLTSSGPGYTMLGGDGTVYAFGSARSIGNASGSASAIAARSNGRGYWITDTAGNVNHFGTAADHGGHPPLRADEWVSAISATPSGNGYWLFTIRGRAYAYGDAKLFGDLSAKRLNGPIVGSVATPSGRGYYMVASDGGVFGFGDARFHGSMGNTRLNRPIVGLASTPNSRGYWLIAADGGVFAFNAPFRGSMGGRPLVQPARAVVAYGAGYLMVASDGGVFNFSDRPFSGSLGYLRLSAPIVGVAASYK
jgi:hypothetical protein